MTTPYAGPPSAPAPWPAKRPVRVWDLVLSIVLLVLLAVLAALTSFFGLFLGMASDPCGGSVQCNGALIGAGVLFALAAPWVILLLAIGVVILLLVKRRLAFWVPLVAGMLVIASWFVGAALASAGVPT